MAQLSVSDCDLAYWLAFAHCWRMNIPTSPNISDVRAQIDAIDAQLAQLIAQRCALSAQVGAAKKAAGDHAFGWRPARETEIVRQVMAAQPALNKNLVLRVWRAMISANLASQGDLRILAVPQTAKAARDTFSVGADVQISLNDHALLKELAQNDHAIGVLPEPSMTDTWWTLMMHDTFAGIYVCAKTPAFDEHRAAPALLLAQRQPQPSGNDVTLFIGPLNFVPGQAIAQAGELALALVAGFTTDAPAHCRVLGSYAQA